MDRSFKNHVRTHAEEIFKCTECPSEWTDGPENMFKTFKQLITHMHEYYKSDNKCRECPKTFSTSSNRIKHEAIHYGTQYECQTCDNIYKNKNEYRSITTSNYRENVESIHEGAAHFLQHNDFWYPSIII